MRNISLKTKIITGLLTGGIYLSSVSPSFAVTMNPLTNGGKAPLTNEYKQISTKTKQDLVTNSKDLVTVNTITKDQANKIKAVINKSTGITKTNIGFTKGLTEQKSKTLSNNINYVNPIKILLDNGTITETQAEKILMKQMYLYHAKMLKSSL